MDDESFGGKKGFIQGLLSIFPLKVVCFTERQLEVLHLLHLKKKQFSLNMGTPLKYFEILKLI